MCQKHPNGVYMQKIGGGGAQGTKRGGEADIIHFFNFEYFKNYAKNEKSEKVQIFLILHGSLSPVDPSL